MLFQMLAILQVLEQAEPESHVAGAILNISAILSSTDVCAHKADAAASLCVAQVKVLGAALHVSGSAEQNSTMKTAD